MTTGNDPIKALEDAGIAVPAEYRQALADLSPEEVRVLVSVRKRIEGASDVAGFVAPTTGLPQTRGISDFGGAIF